LVFSVARVVELVDAADSKSAAARRAGSIPARGTSIPEKSTDAVGAFFVLADFSPENSAVRCQAHPLMRNPDEHRFADLARAAARVERNSFIAPMTDWRQSTLRNGSTMRRPNAR
jgi:hypothetical protein